MWIMKRQVSWLTIVVAMAAALLVVQPWVYADTDTQDGKAEVAEPDAPADNADTEEPTSDTKHDSGFVNAMDDLMQQSEPLPFEIEPDLSDVKPRLVLEQKLSDDFMTKKVSETREIGERTFELIRGIWKEKGYTNQETEFLPRQSDECKELTKADPDIAKILELGDYVFFQVDGHWYKILPGK